MGATAKLRTEGRFSDYDAVFKDWLQEGVIEAVPKGEESKGGYYLPHRHVVKEASTTKIRPVFDASARTRDQPSVNLCLEKGPNLIELIPKILLEFHKGNIGVVADIREAFLQVSVVKRDRDYLKFLWWKDEAATELQEFRHARVVFGVSCSPYLLGAVIALHLQRILEGNEFESDLVTKLARSFYVDNSITSVQTKEELEKFIQDATDIMERARFDLRGWEYSGQGDTKQETPVLGVIWNKETDQLRLNLSDWRAAPEKITKRVILSEANRVFDPIGFSCPVMLCPKLLLQETWTRGLTWDDAVNEKQRSEFLQWREQLNLLQTLSVPRQLLCDVVDETGVSIHTFCDASEKAYAAVVYLRGQDARGTQIQLVMAKARVAPTKTVTIPRMELLAATLGARLTNFVMSELQWENLPVFMWTDSATVLAWIQRDSQWGVFVWNRVQEIPELTNARDWRHVPGSMNPADLPSRGCTVQVLIDSRWWEGPHWLRLPEQQWPVQRCETDEQEIAVEMRKGVVKKVAESATLLVRPENETDQIPWYMGVSSYRRILTCAAWTRRFVYNCRQSKNQKIPDQSKTQKVSGLLSVQEIEEAELCVIRALQQRMFADLDDPRLKTLNPYRDENGIISTFEVQWC